MEEIGILHMGLNLLMEKYNLSVPHCLRQVHCQNSSHASVKNLDERQEDAIILAGEPHAQNYASVEIVKTKTRTSCVS